MKDVRKCAKRLRFSWICSIITLQERCALTAQKRKAPQRRSVEKHRNTNGIYAAKSVPHEGRSPSLLGKDEVASSNLASSSKKSVIPDGMADFFIGRYRFELPRTIAGHRNRRAASKTCNFKENVIL